jgi:putative DNA primase/helicase
MQRLLQKMQSIGLVLDTPQLDGEVHRVKTDGSRNGKKPGWYIVKEVNGKVFATFGRWDTGQKVKYASHEPSQLTKDDLSIMRLIAAKLREQKLIRQAEAARSARKIVKQSRQNPLHPYLIRKQIKSHISLELNNELIIPILDSDGKTVVNVQRIMPDGSKKFLYGGKIKGCYAIIRGDSTVCLCEGFATGATIHEATGHTVVIAFSASNLVPVAETVKPHIICADNDESGTGLRYARMAGTDVRMPDQVGEDWNDVAARLGLSIVASSIDCKSCLLTCEDIESCGNRSLQIPDELINGVGLIDIGIKAAVAAGAPDIRQYIFPSVTAIIARAIAGKFTVRGAWPSFFNIKVGPTSTGKTQVDQIFKSEVFRCGPENFYGPTDFASGPGLLRALSEEGMAQTLVTLDEVTSLFKRRAEDMVSLYKMNTLLELYTNAGTQIIKPYGDSKRSIRIDNPCLVLTGNATPIVFDDLTIEDLRSGMIQRFDFFLYDGPVPRRNNTTDRNADMEKFIGGINWLYQCTSLFGSGGAHDMRSIIPGAIDLGIDPDCEKRLFDYSIEIIDTVNDIDQDEDDRRGIISRRYNLAIKYAMIHLAATRPVDDNFFRPLAVENLEWGIEIARILSEWKINMLFSCVTSGTFHRDCEIFKQAIEIAIKYNRRPVGSYLATRKRRLKELRPREWDDIVKALRARGEIVVDDSAANTAYFLVKQEKNV